MISIQRPPSSSASSSLERLSLGLLVLQPSPFCNINCEYCYLPHRTSTRRMSFEVLDRAMGRVFESGLVDGDLTILWHAGEPLAVPLDWYREAFRIITQHSPADLRILHQFQSNGILVTEDWCDFIEEHRVRIGLSIDGPAFIHDANRKTRGGEGTHAKVLEGAARLRERGIPFGVVAVISELSLDHPDEILRFFEELGVAGVGFNIEEIEGVHTESSLESGDAGSGEARVRGFLERVYELNEAAPRPLKIREFDLARRRFEDSFDPAAPADCPNLETDPFAVLSIDTEGNFSSFSPELLGQPGEATGGFTFGNVMRQEIFDATRAENFRKIHADIREGNRRCRETCRYFAICGGASPSNKFYENGTFASTETMHCRSMIQAPADIVARHLKKTGSGLNSPPRGPVERE